MPGSTKSRRLVLMFDGTWDVKDDWTNVARMEEAIDCVADNDVEEAQNSDVEPKPVQLVKYLEGVGTAWFGKLLGGSFGYGLSEIIQEGYLWLSNQYIEGDEIFVFGFSRGAYSARSLVSLVHRCAGEESRRQTSTALRSSSERRLRPVPRLFEHERRGKRRLRPKIERFWRQKLRPSEGENARSVGHGGIPRHSRLRIQEHEPPGGSGVAHSRGHLAIVQVALPVPRAGAPLHCGRSLPRPRDRRTPRRLRTDAVGLTDAREQGRGAVLVRREPLQRRRRLQRRRYMAVGVRVDARQGGLRFKWCYRAGDEWSSWRTTPEDSYHKFVSGLYAPTKTPFDRVVGVNGAESLHASVKLRIEKNPKYQPKGLAIIPCVDPDKKYKTEIPYVELPVQICSCQKYKKTEFTTPASAKKDK